ncbi:NADP-dependent phosphogluconate dehydrogenase [Altibacter sp. HG106]|uniref:NADP-dependent phosphogluconate dehydrogenase n=1 Tax=Altibacter sp. HG106 TaxID=3023937 RepID=UPI00234FD608|nr:NADP-dependent phosphogluconate dehydrogenase [Altibacter sp. HG106]MDC7993529.1 NADP-dependent phosphogluconate dehydrogenase [Altibacter sp. HG106]
MKKAEFGIIGLGVMGANLASNTIEKGISLSVFNRSEGEEASVIPKFLQRHSGAAVQGHTVLTDFIISLIKPRRILMMIPAGVAVDSVINQLTPLLDKGDILIDGGNSHYKDTFRRCGDLQKEGISFFGVGISGGAQGARNGPSMMVGGRYSDYYLIEPILQSIAAKDRFGTPCVSYLGPQGCGHFVKMVHNGIEYAEMQLLSEVYALLRPHMSQDAMADLLSEWNQGEAQSFLLETTIAILRKKEAGKPLLELVCDQAAAKGTGSWTVQAATELGAPATFTAAALFARSLSTFKKKRSAWSELQNPTSGTVTDLSPTELRHAYQWARLLNHHEGLQLLQIASNHYGWNCSLQEITRVWTNGCILASKLMVTISETLEKENDLLLASAYDEHRKKGVSALKEVVAVSLESAIPIPCFSNALNYWNTIISVSLPSNLIQAQRDSFGGHTYRRKDHPDTASFTTNWNDSNG